MSWEHVKGSQWQPSGHSCSSPSERPWAAPTGSWRAGAAGPGWASTSSAGLGAGGPALECPLVGVRLLQEHIVAPNKGQQVLVDDILVGQVAAGASLSWGEHLGEDGGDGIGLKGREQGQLRGTGVEGSKGRIWGQKQNR